MGLFVFIVTVAILAADMSQIFRYVPDLRQLCPNSECRAAPTYLVRGTFSGRLRVGAFRVLAG
jgi:hypothetical protein